MATIIVGANDSTHTGYDWNFKTGNKPEMSQEMFKFTNNVVIEEKNNFEGSIQIVYTITPQSESPEEGEDECTHEYSSILKASLNNICESNSVSFNYTRTYIHPWEKYPYQLSKTANKVTSYDGLGNNAEDYIWVKYRVGAVESNSDNKYPYIYAQDIYIKDSFPEECVIYKNGVLQEPVKDNDYELHGTNYNENNTWYIEFYAGYPKNIYNDENNNLIVTNYAEKWGTYPLEEEPEKLADAQVTINLEEFKFNYSGNLYAITKRCNLASNTTFYYQNFHDGVDDIGPGNDIPWALNFSVKNAFRKTGLDVKIGDDVLCITNSDSEYAILQDDEYCFSQVRFPRLIDGTGNTINEQYMTELWVRYAENDIYELYDAFLNKEKTYKFNIDDNVVGFYFLIKNVKTDLNPNAVLVYTYIKGVKDMSLTGTLYNFDYLEIYKDGELHNTVGLDSYTTAPTKDIVAQHDINNYKHYVQRGTDSIKYQYYSLPQMSYRFKTTKSMNITNQDAENELFNGTASIGVFLTNDNFIDAKTYLKYSKETLNESEGIKGFELFDLLPEGMVLASTPEEIVNSVTYSSYTTYYNKYKQAYKASEINSLIKEKTEIEIINNWKDFEGNDTNRTFIHIKVNLSESPIYVLSLFKNQGQNFSCTFKYNYIISYESFLEHGATWKNNIYGDWYINHFTFAYGSTYIKDNGSLDPQEKDINKNGNITESIGYATAQTIITSVVSTHQDVTKYVKTDKSNYSTGKVDSSCDSEYEYKLRVRTGQNDVTNLVIYDSIEEYAQDKNGNIVTAYGSKNHWNGEFLGIDTSYAESKGYVVKSYYSENVLAGNLYNDNGTINSDWKEYDDSFWDEYEYGELQTITSPNWPSNYNNNMTEAKDLWEINFPGSESLEITFDSTCKLESASYDYLRFYDKNGNNITNSVCGITAGKIGGSDIAGKTYTIPGDYVKITMRTDGSGVYKGFSADVVGKVFKETHYGTDKTKVKALAFEYLDSDSNAAVLPANSLTYVLIKMKSPDDENITSLAYNGCRTQWQALDEWNRPVDFITGINSNIVKVSLPNSVEDKIVNLSFKKIIDATDEDFDKLKLDKDATYNFFISLTNQDTGDIINGLLDSKEGFRVTNIPTGTYIIKEENDIWFNFVSMGLSEPIEGIDFQEVDGDYILTINATIEADAAIEIDVTNEPKNERYYSSKYDAINLFNLTK